MTTRKYKGETFFRVKITRYMDQIRQNTTYLYVYEIESDAMTVHVVENGREYSHIQDRESFDVSV